VGINGQPVNVQQPPKVPNTVEAPSFFIDVPKKPLKGIIFQQIQTQQNNIPRKEQTNNKKAVFLPGEFTEVQPASGQQQQQQPIINTTKKPTRNNQNQQGNSKRNKTQRQNLSSNGNTFGNGSRNRNRQSKTVNQNSNSNSGKVQNQSFSQIFTTSRPQVTQTFVPRQILAGNNGDKSQKQKGGEKSGSTFTIEQFLARYPEVKRLSSRFGDGKNVQNRVVGNNNNQNKTKNNQNNRTKNVRKGNKRTEGRQSKNTKNSNSNRNNNNGNRNKAKQQKNQSNEVRKQKSTTRKPPSGFHTLRNIRKNKTKVHAQISNNLSNKNKNQQIPVSTTRPIVTTTITTRRPVLTTTTRRPVLTTTFSPVTPAPRNTPRQQKQQRPSNKPSKTQQAPKNQANTIENSVPDVDVPDGELSSVDYSYLYYQDYYDELVPVHHRFNQLATTTTTPKPRPNNQRKKKNKNRNNVNKKKKNGRQGKRNQLQSNGGKPKNKQPKSNSFSFFTSQPADGDKNKGENQGGNFPNFPSSNQGNNKNAIQPQNNKFKTTQRRPIKTTPAPPPPPPKRPALKPSKVGEPKAKPVVVKTNNPLQSGPYGYVDKGTLFTDSHVEGFPTMIEVIYQGFVWALNLYYPGEGRKTIKEKHGGVHTILKDKVKRKKVFFKDGDYIVRVSGRASPYNINRLTFYTAKGKKYGPWGDRRSEDSIDFDETAPPGHGLAYLSGTVDFGVPFRSIAFHWKPHPNLPLEE